MSCLPANDRCCPANLCMEPQYGSMLRRRYAIHLISLIEHQVKEVSSQTLSGIMCRYGSREHETEARHNRLLHLLQGNTPAPTWKNVNEQPGADCLHQVLLRALSELPSRLCQLWSRMHRKYSKSFCLLRRLISPPSHLKSQLNKENARIETACKTCIHCLLKIITQVKVVPLSTSILAFV